MSFMKIEHEAGDENCCETKMDVGKRQTTFIRKETLNGSDTLGTYDVFDDGISKAVFWNLNEYVAGEYTAKCFTGRKINRIWRMFIRSKTLRPVNEDISPDSLCLYVYSSHEV